MELCPLSFEVAGQAVVVQEYLDQILPALLPLSATLCIYAAIKKGIKMPIIILGIVLIGFALGVAGIIAL